MMDSVCNMAIMHLWGKENGPFMQGDVLLCKSCLSDNNRFLSLAGLHLCFGAGGFIAPLLAWPFLLIQHDANLDVDPMDIYNASDLKVQYAYYAIAVYLWFTGAFFFYLYVFHRHTPEHPSRNQVKCDIDSPIINVPVKKAVVCLTILFMHVYCGLEVAMVGDWWR